MKKHIAIRVNAGNDRNGNPRRGWLVVDYDGFTRDFIDEGYSGDSELKEKYGISSGGLGCTEALRIALGEYRDLKKRYQ